MLVMHETCPSKVDFNVHSACSLYSDCIFILDNLVRTNRFYCASPV
jgi:hypothetical protein